MFGLQMLGEDLAITACYSVCLFAPKYDQTKGDDLHTEAII